MSSVLTEEAPGSHGLISSNKKVHFSWLLLTYDFIVHPYKLGIKIITVFTLSLHPMLIVRSRKWLVGHKNIQVWVKFKGPSALEDLHFDSQP